MGHVNRRTSALGFSFLLCALAFSSAHGQSPQGGGPVAAPPGAAVYFIGLKNGATIPTTNTLHFGLRGMGVAPAGSDRENAGHHHLLIDTKLPPLNEPIPNDENHLHFGAGQTEAEITLAPGEHTLQLLLGDRAHVPHSPPIMSEQIRVTVVEGAPPAAAAAPARPAAPAHAQHAAGPPVRHPSPKDAKVYFVFPRDGGYVTRKPTIRFGLINMGVAPAGFEKAGTGHHHLLVDTPLPDLDKPIPNDFNHLHFGAGQTEATVTLPLGDHTLQLLLGDENHVPHDPPIYSKPIRVKVTVSGRKPKPRPRRTRW
jgi:hypothetical protein